MQLRGGQTVAVESPGRNVPRVIASVQLRCSQSDAKPLLEPRRNRGSAEERSTRGTAVARAHQESARSNQDSA